MLPTATRNQPYISNTSAAFLCLLGKAQTLPSLLSITSGGWSIQPISQKADRRKRRKAIYGKTIYLASAL